jgi:chorismate mutase
MSEPRDLPALREAIEAIDRELLAQLRRRMDLAEEVAAAKVLGTYPAAGQG